MLKIRLSMGGVRKRPIYKIVIADSRAARDGKFIEKIGVYDPLLKRDSEDRIKIDLDRVKYWLSNGAQPTDRVHRFLSDAGILTPKIKSSPIKSKPKAKAIERIKEKEDSEKKKLEAAAIQAKTAAEAPVKTEEVAEAPVKTEEAATGDSDDSKTESEIEGKKVD